ncbi:MAG TPA: hypothetical protein VGF99_01260 [Myxococcota bacterium]
MSTPLPADFRVTDLVGRWHIVRTNFPMWLKGDKHAPTFNYAARDGAADSLDDVVEYVQAGKTKRIVGVDRVVAGTVASFVWRGAGVLFFVTSRWHIAHLDRDRGLAVVVFDKTLFTPAGVDVIVRDRAAVDATGIDAAIDDALSALGITTTLTSL